MADVDTSAEAVDRLAAWHRRRADVSPPYRETHGLHIKADATLRALLIERDAAQAQVARLREALDFYACVDHYPIHHAFAPTVVRDDGGKRARAALAECGG